MQIKIAYLYLFDQEFFLQTNPYIDKDLFTNPVVSRSIELANLYYAKYGATFSPDQAVFTSVLKKDPITRRFAAQVDAFLDRIWQVQVSPAEAAYLRDHLREISRQRKALSLLAEGAKLVKDGKVDTFVSRVVTELGKEEEAFEVLDLFEDNMEAVVRVLQDLERERIATLIPSLDRCLHGGIGVEELTIVVGGAGKGKTAFLVNLGYNALLQGKNVLYLTLEVSKYRIYQRIWSLATGLTLDAILTDPQKAIERIRNHKLRKMWGKLRVIESPRGMVTTVNIESYLDFLYLEKKFIPDMLIVDYGDLLKPLRTYDSDWKEVGQIFVDLRRLAVKKRLAVVTASQLNRDGAKKPLARGIDISRSWSKVADADVVLVINRNEEDDKRGRMRILVDKNRNYLSGVLVEVTVDFEKMKIGETLKTEEVREEAEDFLKETEGGD